MVEDETLKNKYLVPESLEMTANRESRKHCSYKDRVKSFLEVQLREQF